MPDRPRPYHVCRAKDVVVSFDADRTVWLLHDAHDPASTRAGREPLAEELGRRIAAGHTDARLRAARPGELVIDPRGRQR